MNQPGHNNPPSIIQFALEAHTEFATWLMLHPVLTSGAEAAEGKALRDRVSLCRKDMDTERKERASPLNEQIKTINSEYREPDRLLGICQQQLEGRLNDYIAKEQAKKIKEAEEKRQTLAEAERRAREAEAAERDVHDSATAGVEVDTVASTRDADRAFDEYQKKVRETARAEKAVEDARKIRGGFGRAYSERHPEILDIVDWRVAINDMGFTDKIRDAVLSSAREHRKVFGELPAGIRKRTEPERN